MIIRIIGEFHPDYVVACYDLPQKTFRHEAYDAYKGHRAKTDEALVAQIESSRYVCEKMGIPMYDSDGPDAIHHSDVPSNEEAFEEAMMNVFGFLLLCFSTIEQLTPRLGIS